MELSRALGKRHVARDCAERQAEPVEGSIGQAVAGHRLVLEQAAIDLLAVAGAGLSSNEDVRRLYLGEDFRLF